MADDNFLMQFGIDINVLGAAPSVATINNVVKAIEHLADAGKALNNATTLEKYFKSLQAYAKVGEEEAVALAGALQRLSEVKVDATKLVEEQKVLQKSIDNTAKAANNAAAALQVLARARNFQAMGGLATQLAADSARLQDFRAELVAAHKAGADLSKLTIPTKFYGPTTSGPGAGLSGQPRLLAEIAAAEAAAISPEEKRLAVYNAINNAITEQANRLSKLAGTGEVTAANRLASAFQKVRAEVRGTADEMAVLIDRAKRVKIPGATGAQLANSRLAFAPTVLGTLKEDPGTVAFYQLQKQKIQELSGQLNTAGKSAKGVETALKDLAKVKIDTNQGQFAAQFKKAAAEVKDFRLQIEQAAKSGELLKVTALPRLQKPGLNNGLQSELQAAQAAGGSQAAVASKQYEIINKYLQEELDYLHQIVAAERERVQTTNATSAAAQRRLDELKAEKDAQMSLLAAQTRSSRVLRENTSMQTQGNFYPLIVATGIWTGLARAMERVDGAAIKNAVSQQQAFSSVKRTANTTGDAKVQIEGIRLALQKLSTQTPVTFEDLSKIATAGNELGLSAEKIPAFTRLVAEYSKVTGTALEDTTKAFGGLAVVLDLPANKLENFGSAISLAGRKSAATESEVVKMTARIGSTAHQAGFAIPQIVGLGAALASIKEPPERSQGALEKFFTNTGKAALEGGAKWKAYSQIVGLSMASSKQLFDSDPYAFFRRFLKGLGDIRDAAKRGGKDAFGVNEAMTSALNSVGLGANVRVKEVFQRLSGTGAQSELDKDVANANKGFAQGTDLSKQYAKQVANLQDQFKELQNAINNFFAAMGKAPVEGLVAIVGFLKDIVTTATHLAQSNRFLANFALGVVAVATAFALLKAASFAAAIATLGLETAQGKLGSTTLLSSIGKMSNLLLGTKFGADGAAASLARLGVASEEPAAGFTLSAASAQKLADEMQILGYEGAVNGEGMALLGRAGIVAGTGLATASKEAQYLAEQLVAANIGIGTTAEAFVVLNEAGIVGRDGFVAAEEGAVGLGGGLRFAAAGGLMLLKSFFGFAILTYLTNLLVDFRGTMMWTADAFKIIQPLIFAVDAVVLGFGATVLKVASILTRVSSIFTGGWIDGGLTVADKLNEASDKLAGTYGHLGATLDTTREQFKKWAAAQKGSTFDSAPDLKKYEAEAAKMLAAQKAAAGGAGDYKAKEKALKDEIASLKATMPDATAAQDKNTAATKKAADAAALAAKNFRTYADYAQELGGVLTRAFDIQFGAQQSHDAIETTFSQLRKQSADATKSIKDARTQIQGINADMEKLRADNVQKSYFLGIANAFGDRVGAASIQADIAKNNADMLDKQNSKSDAYKQISDAYATLDTATAGNTDAALQNRDALSGLVSKYQDYITKLAASGISQKDLNQKVKEARDEFLKQGAAMGFSKQQLAPYAKAMSGFGDIVRKIPRNVTVTATANTSAAALALDEFFKKKAVDAAAEAAQKMNSSLNSIGSGMNSAMQKRIDDLNKQLNAMYAAERKRKPVVIPGVVFARSSGVYNARMASDMGQISGLNAELKQAISNGRPERVLDDIIRRMKLASNAMESDQKLSGRFYTGGYTGSGGKYEPAGIVHKGEYVVPKYMVNQSTGLPYADALGRLMAGTRPQAGYAAGGYVNPDVMVVEPGPKFMRKLQEIVQTEVSAVIEPRAIAGANTDYLTGQRRRGSSR